MPEHKTDVAILGGGFSGMGAAYRLGQLGIPSVLLEAEEQLGGLGGSVEIGGDVVEKFYHHIKPDDTTLLDLMENLGLSHYLSWASTHMGFYASMSIYPFSGPLDLFRFPDLSFIDKLRFGLGVLRIRKPSSYAPQGVHAAQWARDLWGDNVYEKLIAPMLLNKFGLPPDQVSGAFLHGRVKSLSSSKSTFKKGERLACVRGSLDRITESLAERLMEYTDILTDFKVERIEKTDEGFCVLGGNAVVHCKNVINTLPIDIFTKIQKNFNFDTNIDYQGVICAALSVKEPMTPLYWINIIDQDIYFRVLVNHSCFGGFDSTILYCANYVHRHHPTYEIDDDTIVARYMEGLEKMFGTFTLNDIVVSRSPYATPIFTPHFKQEMEALNAKIPGMYFAGSAKIFPNARTVSTILNSGYKAADKINQSRSR